MLLLKDRFKQKVTDPKSAAKIFQSVLATSDKHDRDKEHFWVIGLNSNNTVKFVDLVNLGILTSSLIHPRETFRLAVLKSAASIIIGHNHPSGDPSPSEEDIERTKKIKKAGYILGIKMLDHIIIANNSSKFASVHGNMPLKNKIKPKRRIQQ